MNREDYMLNKEICVFFEIILRNFNNIKWKGLAELDTHKSSSKGNIN